MKTSSLVILDIDPHRIKPEAWAEAYDDTHAVLVASPARLLGYDWTTVADIALPLYTRAIERDHDKPTARRWCVAGERESLAVGEPQTMHHDLRPYMACRSTLLDDILLAYANDGPAAASEASDRPLPAHPVPSPNCPPDLGNGRAGEGPVFGLARVFGDAVCPASYAVPMLAAAIVVEARFPCWAMVHGDFSRELAEAAQRWAEGVLHRPIALPVRLDVWRVMERLKVRFERQWLVSAVERLHLAPAETRYATLLRLFDRVDADPWWLDWTCSWRATS